MPSGNYSKYSHLDKRMMHLQGCRYKSGATTINEDEIRTIIIKNHNNSIQRWEAMHYCKDKKRYFIVYESGYNKKISNWTLNWYRCTDTDKDWTKHILRISTILQRANIEKDTKIKQSPAREATRTLCNDSMQWSN